MSALFNNASQPTAHRNPLDRNGDGKVDLKDLTGRQSALAPGMMQTTTQTSTLTSLPMTSGLSTGIDRNHDGIDDRLQGRRLSQGYDATLLNQQGAYIQSERRASLVRAEPTVRETIQKEVVVHERIHPVQKEEIQPIIYREREQLDVKQVTQMLHETQIEPTILQQRNLEAQYREAVVERGAPIMPNVVLPSSQREAVTRTQVIHAPIVEEIIKKTIIEEVQPVLERDVIQATVIQNTQPIYEKIIEAPTITREVLQTRELGTVNSSSFTSEMSTMGQRRLSQTYTNTALPLQGQRLSGNYNDSVLMNQGQYQSVPLQGQRLSGNLSDNYLLQQQNKRLSGSYVDPLLLQQSQGQYAIAGPAQMQSRRLSQTYSNTALPLQGQRLSGNYNDNVLLNQGQYQSVPLQGQRLSGNYNNNVLLNQGLQSTQPLLPGLNNTALGTAHMAPASHLQGYGQSTMGLNSNVRYANSGSSTYGLQGSEAYRKTLEMERMRDIQAAQATPLSLNRM